MRRRWSSRWARSCPFRSESSAERLSALKGSELMEKVRGVDYYGIEDLLSEEERMVRDAIRDWVEVEFLPLVTQHHRAGTFPVELIPKLGELGVFGATLKGYGCAGLNSVAYGLIMQELERGDSGLRSCASVQSGLVMYPIYAYGSDAQKDRWLLCTEAHERSEEHTSELQSRSDLACRLLLEKNKSNPY